MKKLILLSLVVVLSFAVYAESVFANTKYWPVPASKRVTQEFGGQHKGMDIGGSTAGVAGDRIVAMSNGKVGRAGWSSSYGYVVYIFHEGSQQVNYTNLQTRYAHFMKEPSVSVGQTVLGGQTVGYMGNTGESQGVHLHFETRTCGSKCDATNDSTPVNPRNYLNSVIPAMVSSSHDTKGEDTHDHDGHGHDNGEVIEIPEDDFYSMEEIKNMTPEERIAIGYPFPYKKYE